MGLVEGETLAARIARGKMPAKEAIPLFGRIADALDAAHEKSVIHRDLKPANIMITLDGKPRVLDFGLAKTFQKVVPNSDASQSPTLTKGTAFGVIMGTASYMSPEQARGEPVDKRTNIWAFGCCLYEALTARKAFPGVTVTDAIAAIIEREPDWSLLPQPTPPDVRRILERCLVKERRDRTRDAGDIRIELETASRKPADPVEMPSSRYVLGWAIATAMTFVAGVAVWMSLSASNPNVTRLSAALPSGFEITADRSAAVAIDADGRRLAFTAATRGGTRQLFMRKFGSFDAEPMESSSPEAPALVCIACPRTVVSSRY